MKVFSFINLNQSNSLDSIRANPKIRPGFSYSIPKTKLERFSLKDSTPKGGGVCDPLFFKPNDHMKHMEHMNINDKSYLDHMIPHHQVALDMSYRLLEHTNNTHMIRICYEIIVAQRAEILKMNYILDYMKKNNLEFLPTYY